MKPITCKQCGETFDEGADTCPYCGTPHRKRVPTVWILAFFVLGMVMGLMLLILQQGGLAKWRSLEWPSQLDEPPSQQTAGSSEPVRPRVQAVSCDREQAQRVYDKVRTLATLSQQGNILTVQLGGAWAYYAEGHRRGMVEAFSEADRCLSGQQRSLRFTYQGEEVASVSRQGHIEVK